MTGQYLLPELLARQHGLDSFECRSQEQTEWLQRHGRQASAGGLSKVLVVAEAGTGRVAAYYAWSMASIRVEDAPERLVKGAGRYPQPVALLARLGVATTDEGNGLGAALVQDVIKRALEVSATIGCRGLLVHAESEEAKSFYLHLVPEFEQSPTDKLHLVLLMKDIRRTLTS